MSTECNSGLFTIISNDKTHTIDFGKATGHPSCTCQDWINWQIPCKHFFVIFRLIPRWDWYCLPQKYLCSAYISSDTASLKSGLHAFLANGVHSTVDDCTIVEADNPIPDQSDKAIVELHGEIPSRKVKVILYIYIIIPKV